MKRVVLLFVLFFFSMPNLVADSAQQPLDMLRGPIDQVISILKDPQYQDEGQNDVKMEKIWNIIRELFDFTEMGKRSLARNWGSFTPQQRKEFSQVFAKFLGNTYIHKIQKDYKNEEVIYEKQEMVTKAKAIVKTKVIRDTLEIPVNYRMLIRHGVWRVYDVNIEGVSLVKNYRSQFGKILMRKSPAQLIERLRENVKKQKKG